MSFIHSSFSSLSKVTNSFIPSMHSGWAGIYADDGTEIKDFKRGEHCRNYIRGEVLEVPFGDSDFLRFDLHTEHEGSHIISEFVILEDGFGLDSGMNDLSIVLRKRYRLWILEDRKADRRVGRQAGRQSLSWTERPRDRQTLRETDIKTISRILPVHVY